MDRALRGAEHRRRLRVGPAFEQAEHHDRPEPVGEPGDLGVHGRPHLVGLDGGRGRRGHRHLVREGSIGPPGAAAGGLQGDQVRHPVQPAGERLASDGRGRRGEGEEHGLEGVLGVGVAAEPAAAEREHHRPVPADEPGEGVAVGGADVPAEQVGIGVGRRRAEPAEDAEEPAGRCAHPHLRPGADAGRVPADRRGLRKYSRKFRHPADTPILTAADRGRKGVVRGCGAALRAATARVPPGSPSRHPHYVCHEPIKLIDKLFHIR